jgi:hypothetical protein
MLSSGYVVKLLVYNLQTSMRGLQWDGDTVRSTLISIPATEHTRLKQHDGLVQSYEIAICKDHSGYRD